MANDKLRRQIVSEAARLLYHRRETEYSQATIRAARRFCRRWVKPADLPSHREVREEILRFTRAFEKTDEQETRSDTPVEGEVSHDRFQVFRALLMPLEHVREKREYHPESDALYHSLQVFKLACDEIPYDEEFLLAALLHDVGKAIDPYEHVVAGLEALDEFITDRTAWLIEQHMLAHALADGSIGVRARRRLMQSDDFDTLVLLNECDRAGRVPGMEVPDVDEALEYLRDLAKMCG
jgi:hypothetical protein